MVLEGIDVSVYQENVDWATVASQGIVYGFAKATEGATSSDPLFARNWREMRSQGIVRGAYHFFRPGRDPAEQVNNFLKVVGAIESYDLPPVLDLEIMDGLDAKTVIDRATKWLQLMETKTGRKPILYTFPNYWEEKLGNPADFNAYPLWIANFGAKTPYIPSAWRSWIFHQYSESGTVRGITGNVDLNQFNGNLDALQKLLKGRIPLRQGYEGDVVQTMQQLLKSKGFDIGTPDGDFGSKTKAAVMSFQKSKNLYADGIVGAATWAALEGKSTPTPTPTPVPAPTPVVQPITLVNVCKSYGSLPHQDQALTWLQSQIPQATMDEFAKRWRQKP
jgi:lysozyme